MRNIFSYFQLIIFISYLHTIQSNLLDMTNADPESTNINKENNLYDKIKVKRYTLDGRACADSFITQGEILLNCAKTLTPDGLKINKEWCNVENPQVGFQDWDYCIPTIDYEYIRKYNQSLKQEMSKSLKGIAKRISSNIVYGENILDKLKSLKLSQTELRKKIYAVIENLEKIRIKLQNLNLKKQSLISQAESIKDLKFKLAKRSGPDNTKLVDPDIKSRDSNKKDLYDCKGMMLYEDADDGDGLLGKYYNNEYWDGTPVEVVQGEIDEAWGGTTPIDNINPNNFSVQWIGYLKAPVSGEYVFTIEADDGYELTIRHEVVIRNKLDLDIDDENNPLLDIGISISPDDSSFKSLPVILESESRVKLLLKYYHSIHNDIVEKRDVYIRLYWSTEDIEKEIIPKMYLFLKDNIPAFKISINDNNSLFAIRKLIENDSAFINNDNFYLQDIPKQFISSTALKFVYLYQDPEIIFEINLPCIVNVGVLSLNPNPLDDSFEKSEAELSLVRIENTKNNVSKYLRGVKTGSFSIYSHSFEAGDVKIPLKYEGTNLEGIPLILFFTFDRKRKNILECLGDEVNISKSSGEYFKNCSASSEMEEMGCFAGFSGDFRDEEGSIWASFDENVGAWIEIEFSGVFEIRKLIYKNRKNPYSRNKVLELNFSNNRKSLINIKYSDDILEFPLIPIKSHRVRITIKEVYGEVNNGGAFGFIGKKCNPI